MSKFNPICVALDTPDMERAVTLAKALVSHVGMMKIGMEFFYANGPKGYDAIASSGMPIFLDMKLHDIPNTVAQGLKSLMALKPAITNIHSTGGLDMMKAARDAVRGDTKLIAVTVLTSLSTPDAYEAGFGCDTQSLARKLALLAKSAGLDGVVCSPHDIKSIKGDCGKEFLTVVPGIRPADAASDDQKRIATPKAAIDAGADILVIGRAITGAVDPAQAAHDILQSLAS
jgi:orotidine-5'-phosphate decarboxylase